MENTEIFPLFKIYFIFFFLKNIISAISQEDY